MNNDEITNEQEALDAVKKNVFALEHDYPPKIPIQEKVSFLLLIRNHQQGPNQLFQGLPKKNHFLFRFL